MKKLLITGLIVAGSILSANAQTGSILLYGNVGFNTNNKSGGTSDPTNVASVGSFSINPGIGYQFNKLWTVGVAGGYNYTDNGYGINKVYSAGAFLRYSKHLAGIFSLYGQLDAGYQGEKNVLDKVTTTADGFYATLTPVLSASIKNGFALNFSIGGLDYSSLNWKGGVTQSTFGLTFGKAVSIGISKNFGGK